MEKKLKVTLVAATAAITAFSATAVKADETTQPDTPETVEATVTEVKVTEQDVKEATAKADQTQDAVKKQEAVVTEKTIADKEAGEAVTKAEKDVKDAESVTTEEITKAREEATKAASALTVAEKAFAIESTKAATAKVALSTAASELTIAQSKVEQATQVEKNAQDKVNSLGGGSTALTEAEQASREATKKVQTADRDQKQAEAELTTAKADDAKAAVALKTAQDAKAKADQDLKNLGEQPKGYDFSDVKFILGKELADALNERAKLMGESGDKFDKNSQAVQNASNARLAKAAENAKKNNTYTNTTDKREVDLLNLSEDQKTEINLFGLTIVNQIRAELGHAPLKTTIGMQEFANEAAESRNNNPEYRYRFVTQELDKSGKPIRDAEGNFKWIDDGKVSYYYKGINDAARVHGLSLHDGAESYTKQRQAEITTGSSESEAKNRKFYGEGNDRINSLTQKSKADVIKEKKDFKITMGAVKEHIYDAYKKFMFEPNLSDNRAWEQGLSVGGSIDFRNSSNIPELKSIYGATSISFSERISETHPDLESKVPNEYYRYNIFPEINVLNFQTAGEDPALKPNSTVKPNSGAFIVDSSKFDATEIKNDPNATVKYNNEKKALEDAVKKADADLATASSYKAKTPAAQEKVNTATTALNEAKTAEKAAQDKVDTLRVAQTNQSESLKKAQEELTTAQANVKTTQAALATAQDRFNIAQAELAIAIAGLEKADNTVVAKVIEVNQANQTVKDLESAQTSLVQRQVALATAKTAKEKAEKELTEAQTELRRLQVLNDKAQAEKKDILERYRKQNPITEKGEPWIEPALPEFPIDKVPGGNIKANDKAPVYPPKPAVQAMAQKPASASKAVVPVVATKQLPNTGDNNSLATVAMGVVAAVSAFGLASKRKED